MNDHARIALAAASAVLLSTNYRGAVANSARAQLQTLTVFLQPSINSDSVWMADEQYVLVALAESQLIEGCRKTVSVAIGVLTVLATAPRYWSPAGRPTRRPVRCERGRSSCDLRCAKCRQSRRQKQATCHPGWRWRSPQPECARRPCLARRARVNQPASSTHETVRSCAGARVPRSTLPRSAYIILASHDEAAR